MAFQQLKQYLTRPPLFFTPDEGKYLTSPPLLSTPNKEKLLYVYLVILEHAVSSVLLREVDKEQRLIYFVSKTFTDFQIRYLVRKKMLLALVITSWKLMHYFQAHSTTVYTEFLLKNILIKANLSERLYE